VWQTLLEDIGSAIELLQEADDAALRLEATSGVDLLTQELDRWPFWNPYDQRDAQITITATSGGEGVYAWVLRLARMYTQWADRQCYQVKELEVRDWEGGALLVTIAITGKGYVYGSLKQESGVHQMTAIPLFEDKGKRQNYQATVEVAPIVHASPTDIPATDWEVRPCHRYLGSSIIITAHGICVTHRPTGRSCTLFDCSSGTETAIDILTTRLLGKMLHDSTNSDQAIVRHYAFEPNPLVKDDRTGYTTTKINEILAGEIDDLLELGIRGGFNDRIQTSANPP
jgi:peptide chain release factor 1